MKEGSREKWKLHWYGNLSKYLEGKLIGRLETDVSGITTRFSVKLSWINQSFATFNRKPFGNFLVSLINQSSSKSVWSNYRESTVLFVNRFSLKCQEFSFMTEFKEVEIKGIFWPINFKIHETYFPFYVRFLQ
jgi:hypothetical protein